MVSTLVYRWCMSRTNIDLDDEACRAVMERYQLRTKRDAVNFALRTLAAEPLTVEEARRLRGSGWEGNLDDIRTSRAG
jgi:Arc/MetJ family transcription regulator